MRPADERIGQRKKQSIARTRAVNPAKAVLLICAAALLLYAPLLGYSPAYLAHDEVFYALSAHSIAFTGQDLNGRFLPLYFQWPARLDPHMWFQPIPVYFTALFLRVLPVSEWAVRLPTLLVGMTDIVLVYFIAARICQSELAPIAAAALLTLTPAHFIHSRLAMDLLYPLPFVLAWFLCLLLFIERRQLWLLFAATSFLGVGFYSYIGATVMMPLYFGVTCLTVLKMRLGSVRPLLVAAVGFVLPLTALMSWWLGHQTAVADTAARYGLAPLLVPHSGRALMSLPFLKTITERISLYWQYFDPAYLFLAGGGYTLSTTHRVGVFLLPLAVFLVIGLNEIVNRRPTWPNLLLVFGLLSAPVAACLVGEPYAIQRELEVVPFVVLLATIGAESLISAGRTLPRRLAWCVLALIPLQFSVFYLDYFTQYRVRSAFGFEGNIRGALEQIIDREQTGAVYLSTDVRFVELYWRLYLIKHRREDLLQRTVYFDPRTLDVRIVPRRSLILMSAANGASSALVGSGIFRRVSLVANIDQTVCCEILENVSGGI